MRPNASAQTLPHSQPQPRIHPISHSPFTSVRYTKETCTLQNARPRMHTHPVHPHNGCPHTYTRDHTSADSAMRTPARPIHTPCSAEAHASTLPSMHADNTHSPKSTAIHTHSFQMNILVTVVCSNKELRRTLSRLEEEKILLEQERSTAVASLQDLQSAKEMLTYVFGALNSHCTLHPLLYTHIFSDRKRKAGQSD